MPVDESVVGKLSLVGSHNQMVGKLALVGNATRRDDDPGLIAIKGLVQAFDHFGNLTIAGLVHQVGYAGELSIKGEVHQRSLDGAICMVSVVRELPVPVGPHPVGSSTPLGVLPQTGSAIFTKWEAMPAKQVMLHRHWDFHESGRARHPATRQGWRLEVEVATAKHDEIVQFFIDHIWAGKSFYFYDLEANGYQYDPTGVLTSGRYKVRFIEEQFPRVYSVGERFRIPFSVIEVD